MHIYATQDFTYLNHAVNYCDSVGNDNNYYQTI